MSNINYNGYTYNVVFIDPGISVAGDGSTTATALSDFPQKFVDNTCYIVKKYTDEINLVRLPKLREADGINNIIVMGYPIANASDIIWKQLSDQGINDPTWDSDVAKYANILCNTSNTSGMSSGALIFSNKLKNYISMNCYYFRNESTPSASSYINPIFFNNSNDRNNSFIFTNCKFGYTSYDFEKGSYLKDNADVTPAGKNKCGCYLVFQSVNNVVLDDCIFNVITDDKNPSSFDESKRYNSILNVTYGNLITFKNSKINVLVYKQISSSYRYNRIIKIGPDRDSNSVDPFQVFNLINTLTTVIYASSSNDYTTRIPVFDVFADYLNINNAYTNFVAMQGGENRIFQMHSTSFAFYTYYFYSKVNTQIDGFYCYPDIYSKLYKDENYPKTLTLSGLPLLEGQFNPYLQGIANSYIKNIYVDFMNYKDAMGQAIIPNHILTSNDYIIKIYGINTEHIYYPNGSDFTTLPSSSGTDNMMLQYTSFIFENINLYCQYYKPYILWLAVMGLKADTIRGRVDIGYHAALEVKNLYNYDGSKVGIDLGVKNTTSDFCYFKCDNYEVNLSNYTGLPQIKNNYLNSVYVYKSNCALFDTTPFVPGKIESADDVEYCAGVIQSVCPNYIAPGQLFARNMYSFMQSWSTKRTGSTANASIKLYNNSFGKIRNRQLPISIGNYPYKGLTYTLPSAGQINPETKKYKYKLKAYFACKNFAELAKLSFGSNCWLEISLKDTIDLPFNSEYASTNLLSTRNMQWHLDTEPATITWQGDVGLKSYWIEKEFEIKDPTQPIDVSLFYNLYDPNGYMYFDPDIQFEAI